MSARRPESVAVNGRLDLSAGRDRPPSADPLTVTTFQTRQVNEVEADDPVESLTVTATA